MNSPATTASQNCVYHKDRPSAGECTECHQPTCFGCQVMVAGKSVCQNCVAAIRAHVNGQVNSSSGSVMAPPAPYSYSAGASGSDYTYQPAVSTVADIEDLHAPPSAMGLLAGSGLGLLAGVICAFLSAKFIFVTHFNISYIAIGVGIVIG